MDFYPNLTVWDVCRKLIPPTNAISFYEDHLRDMRMQFGVEKINRNASINSTYRQLDSELSWYEGKQPYYKVWPGIIPCLTKLKHEKIPTSELYLPCDTILFRFPIGNTLTFPGGSLQTILVNRRPDQLTLWIDFGEKEQSPLPECPVLTYRVLQLTQPTVQEAVDPLIIDGSADVGLKIPPSIVTDCVRIVAGICLLSHDNEDRLVEWDVLSKDAAKFSVSGDQKFIDKAKRRGKFGWNVGKSVEVSPHYRQSHLALYWCGKGRVNPTMKYRRGAIVKREVVKKVPTSYGGK